MVLGALSAILAGLVSAPTAKAAVAPAKALVCRKRRREKVFWLIGHPMKTVEREVTCKGTAGVVTASPARREVATPGRAGLSTQS
jgi:hypothetical protein